MIRALRLAIARGFVKKALRMYESALPVVMADMCPKGSLIYQTAELTLALADVWTAIGFAIANKAASDGEDW